MLDRRFYKICVLITMWWVQAKGEESLIMGAVRVIAHNMQPISFNYQEYDAKP